MRSLNMTEWLQIPSSGLFRFIFFIAVGSTFVFSCSSDQSSFSISYQSCADKPTYGLSQLWGRYVSFSFFPTHRFSDTFIVLQTEKKRPYLGVKLDVEFTHNKETSTLQFNIKGIQSFSAPTVHEALYGSATYTLPHIGLEGTFTMLIQHEKVVDRYYLTIHSRSIHIQCLSANFSVFLDYAATI